MRAARAQLAVKKEAADTWQFIKDETARRKQLLHDEQVRAAIEKAKPRSKKARKVKPWVSLGSEVSGASFCSLDANSTPPACHQIAASVKGGDA